MKSTWLAIPLALAFAASCSDPSCGPDQRLVGNTCRNIGAKSDGGHDTDEDPRAEVAADASLDAAPDASFQVRDDGSAGGEDASSLAAGPACGDGILNGTEFCDPRIAAGTPGACPTAASCKSSDPCSLASLVGDAAACNARCETAPQRECKNDDACCPAGCTSATDDDCSASCGNQFVDAKETCDGNCPTSCPDDGDACTIDAPAGNAAQCNVLCPASAARAKKPKNAAADGCCPQAYDATANSTNDPDCAPTCGNNVKETGELCDGADCPATCPADGNACTSDTVQGSACTRTCSYPKITTAAADGCCIPGETYPTEPACPGCGNGKVEAGEQCDDGSVAGGDGCASCRWEDLATIPGDERPGYFICGTVSCPQTSATGAKQYCLRDASNVYRCGPSAAGDKAECDGPEDCPAANSCVRAETEEVSYFCVSKSVVTGPNGYYYHVYCHSTADCVAPTTCKFSSGAGDFISYGACL